MDDIHDRVSSEQSAVLGEIESLACFVTNDIDAIKPEDFELRDLAMLQDIRKKLDEINSRIEAWYDGR